MSTETELQRSCDAAVRTARTDGERAAVHSLNPPGWPNVAPGSVLAWYADALWELARRAGRAAGLPETGAIALSEWVTAHSGGLCTPATLRTLTPWLADEPTEFLERVAVGTQNFCAKVMWQAAGTREAAETPLTLHRHADAPRTRRAGHDSEHVITRYFAAGV
ncbi:hypothetical protein F3K43_47355 [Streptomyces sp. LBUM 1476]|nr:hypothetical protein [Streptomyces sp. LBUM 1476]